MTFIPKQNINAVGNKYVEFDNYVNERKIYIRTTNNFLKISVSYLFIAE